MPTVEKFNSYMGRVNAMPEKTAAQRARKAEATRHLYNAIDCGRFGRVEELLTATDGSNKEHVARQGQVDVFIRISKGGNKAMPRACEVKTNGGRVQSIIDAVECGKTGYVVYSMDVCNKSTSDFRRVTGQKLFTYEEFLTVLTACKALKSTNGKNPEVAIQVSSKKLWLAVDSWPRDYIRGAVYEF